MREDYDSVQFIQIKSKYIELNVKRQQWKQYSGTERNTEGMKHTNRTTL